MGNRKVGSDSFHADEDQVGQIERYAADHGATVEFLPPELSLSGGLPIEERPSLRSAIEGVESGKYSGVIVGYLSRLTRSRSGIEIWERVEAAGGHVHCAVENIDTSTANGRFVRDIHLANAVREREEHADRFEERRRHSTAAGIWQRRQTPTGYRKDKSSRKLVPGRRADVLGGAFRDFLAGRPIVDLARDLGMTPSGVRYLLRNRVYLGELKVGQHVNPDAHPPLVDLETFEAVQAKLKDNVRPARNGRPLPLLAGVVRCASCGHVMTRASSNGGSAYSCPTHHSGQRCPSPAAVMTSRLDPYVESIALAELARLQVSSTEGSRVEERRREFEDAERELATFLEAVSAVTVGVEAFAGGARKRRDDVDAAQQAMRQELARTPAVPIDGTGADAWNGLEAHERNTLLRSLLAAVVVRPAGRGRTVPISERVRVVAHGAELVLPGRNGGEPGGIVPVDFEDLDGDAVLGVPAGEDSP